jgi:outer membrane protein TolC
METFANNLHRTERAGKWILGSRSLIVLLISSFVSGSSAGADLELSLREAVRQALSEEGNIQVQVAVEQVREVEALSRQARAAFFPKVEANLSQQDQTRNLEAFGLQPAGLFRPPTLVGPFTVLDARASASQTLFDLGMIRRYQASRAALEAAETRKGATDDQVAAGVARAYLTAQRELARLEAARSNLDLAATLRRLAESQREAGTGTGIDVTRARVQLSNQQQLLLTAERRHRQALLELAKLIGMDLGLRIQLTDPLAKAPLAVSTLPEALSTALEFRSDLLAQRAQEHQFELNHRAARMERIPSLRGFFDYGTIGTSFANTLPTWTLGLSIHLPIFDGGGMEARRAESRSQLRVQHLRTSDLERQIELEVRVALDGLELAAREIQVAEEGMNLAEAELAQARRRYEAGITTSVEVTDAQARLERARENHIGALFVYNLERINLAEAMGVIQRSLP